MLAGVTSGVTMSAGQAAAAAATGAPMSATVKVLGPSALMKQVKDTSSAGSMLSSRPGTAVVSLQPVLIRPGTAVTVASSQTSTIQASVVGTGRTSTGMVATLSASGSNTVQPMLSGVQQAVQDIVQQAQAQAARQNSVSFVSTAATTFPQQTPTMVAGSTPSGSSVSPVTAIQTAVDAAAAASQNKSSSSPYVMRLRNQRS